MNTNTELEQEAMNAAPKGTLFLLLVFGLLMFGGWLAMFFWMFLAHGPVS